MTMRQAGQHRRRTPAAAPIVQELRRTRALLDATADELAAVTGERDQYAAALADLWQLVNDEEITSTAERHRLMARVLEHQVRADLAEAALAGRPAEPYDVDEPAPWPTAIDPELDQLRYPPHGRKRFGEPRPGEYAGGPVDWRPGEVEGQAS